MSNKGLFPEIINNFHLYKGGGDQLGEMLLGIGSQLEMPSLQEMTETLTGSGVLGEVEANNPGHFSVIEMKIPYVGVCEGMFDTDSTQRTYLTIRSTQQSSVKQNGAKSYSGLKMIIGGDVKSYELGTMEMGKQTNSSVTMSITYIKIEIKYEDGTTVTALELDKFNEIFIKNGVDQLAKIKAFAKKRGEKHEISDK